MTLCIDRFKDITDGTIGRFVLKDDKKELLKGYTLEPSGDDEVKPNLDRRIPAGLYNTSWHQSPKFKQKLPLLHNKLVNKDRYILIHAGNYPQHTEGCILLGARYDEKGVYQSKDTLFKFLALLKDAELKVRIDNKIEMASHL